MSRFCVECGKETERLVNGMCMECFLKDRELVSLPSHVNMHICTNCGRYLRHGEWVKAEMQEMAIKVARESLEVIREVRILGIEGSSYFLDDYNISVTLDCKISISDFETKVSAMTVIRVKNDLCKVCSRRLGNYYASILQIRASGRARTIEPSLQDEVLRKVEKEVDSHGEHDANSFITKMEIVPGGVDIYLSQISLGKGICKILGNDYCAETNESSKLVGQTRDGLDMYRVSYLVRLPEFHLGDIVEYQGKHWLITKVLYGGGKLLSLSDFRTMSVKRRDMSDLKVFCKSADLQDATVISSTPGEVQVMDPQNYESVDILVPEGTQAGETVKVVRIDEILYYVPSLKE